MLRCGDREPLQRTQSEGVGQQGSYGVWCQGCSLEQLLGVDRLLLARLRVWCPAVPGDAIAQLRRSAALSAAPALCMKAGKLCMF